MKTENILIPWFKITCSKSYFATHPKFKIRQIFSESLNSILGVKYDVRIKQENLIGGANPILNYIVEFTSCSLILRAYYQKYFLCIDTFWFNTGNTLSEGIKENFISSLRSKIVARTLMTGIPISLNRELNWKDVSHNLNSPIILERHYKKLLEN